MFLDDTACNLASLNLLKFESTNSDPFDFEAFSHAVRLWTLVLDISVTMAQFPSKEIARRSHDYRTLGLPPRATFNDRCKRTKEMNRDEDLHQQDDRRRREEDDRRRIQEDQRREQRRQDDLRRQQDRDEESRRHRR
jgi:hypothetical protein